ncbi:MAG: hypothetical protein AAGG55_00135 [Pseudomonadota bacterium]
MTCADEVLPADADVFFSDSYMVFDLQADYAAGPGIFRFTVANLCDEDHLQPNQLLL